MASDLASQRSSSSFQAVAIVARFSDVLLSLYAERDSSVSAHIISFLKVRTVLMLICRHPHPRLDS